MTRSNQSETGILIICLKLTNQIAELIDITFTGLLPKRKVLLSIYGKFNLNGILIILSSSCGSVNLTQIIFSIITSVSFLVSV